MNSKKMLMSVAAAFATGKLARAVLNVDPDAVLGRMGLARRRSRFFENAALIGAGAALGAGLALLYAPATGKATRAKLGKQLGKLSDAASEAVAEVKAAAPSLLNRRVSNEESVNTP
jgi:hypothetical protein